MSKNPKITRPYTQNPVIAERVEAKRKFARELLSAEFAKGNVLSNHRVNVAVFEEFDSGIHNTEVSELKSEIGIPPGPHLVHSSGGTLPSAIKKEKAVERGQKANITRKRRLAGKKAARTRKLRATLALKNGLAPAVTTHTGKKPEAALLAAVLTLLGGDGSVEVKVKGKEAHVVVQRQPSRLSYKLS